MARLAIGGSGPKRAKLISMGGQIVGHPYTNVPVRPSAANVRKAMRATADRRVIAPAGNPGSRGRPMGGMAPQMQQRNVDYGAPLRAIPRINIKAPDLSGIGRAFANNPIDRLYKEIGNRINRATGGR